MSKYTFKKLGLTRELAKQILESKPIFNDEVYWSREIKLYYAKGPRRNALVYCKETDRWRTATRHNCELDDLLRYPSLYVIANLRK